MTAPDPIIAAIHAGRVDLSDEKRAQADIGLLLTAAGLGWEREVRLGNAGIIDFVVGGEIGLEVKLHAHNSASRMLRQLERYAETGRFRAMILASNRAMSLPPQVRGVDAYFASLGRGWL